ncbi:hypothetical protein EYZ11_009389 [Aspergillus tanneri]|uniref:Uncharacterized protein n=1 Tax=Aspergillus tanneri TaxID=1220188 RepID=A0A4S3J801_9EURO|nr:hypothetical protein EYZ11_009389 [Aspergillus tanneri]
MSLPTEPKTWTKNDFLISTDKNLLSLLAINSAFDLEMVYWAQPFPESILQELINNSFCFGLYKVTNDDEQAKKINPNDSNASPKKYEQIGFARLATDFITPARLAVFEVDYVADFTG